MMINRHKEIGCILIGGASVGVHHDARVTCPIIELQINERGSTSRKVVYDRFQRDTMSEQREKVGERRHTENYFEYEVIAGTWRGADARLLGQSSEHPGTLDVEVRRGKAIRGPLRLPLDWLRWRGPKGS